MEQQHPVRLTQDDLDVASRKPLFFELLPAGEFRAFVLQLLALRGYDVALNAVNVHVARSYVGDMNLLLEVRHADDVVDIDVVRSLCDAGAADPSIQRYMMIVSTSYSTASNMFMYMNRDMIRLVDGLELQDWARECKTKLDRIAADVTGLVTRLPIWREYATITFSSASEIPSAADIIADLGLPLVLTERLQRVDALPFNLLRRIAADPRAMHALSPYQFEEFIAETLSALGFVDVLHTPRSGDGGRDVIAHKLIHGIPLTFFVECKKYAEGNAVQLSVLRALLGVVAHRSAANIGVLVTTSRFTKGCIELLASETRLDGKDYQGILGWLREWRKLQ